MSVSRTDRAGRCFGLAWAVVACGVTVGTAVAETPEPAAIPMPALSSPADDGLGPDPWAGSPPALVRRLLAELPVAAPSPAQRALTQRLLRSAEPAEQPAEAAGDSVTDPSGLTGKGPAALAAIARSETVDADLRVIAAERAAATGALPPSDLATAYASVRLAPAALAHPLSASEPGARGRALVYQVTVGETQPAVAAELIRHWLDLLEPAQAVGPVALVPLAILERLPAEATTAWLAPAAVRAFLSVGRPDGATVWLRLPPTAESAAALLALWPLGTLSGLATGGDLDAWLGATLAHADAARRGRVAAILALLQAAGEPVKDDAWAQTADQTTDGQGAAMPSPALWRALDDATASRRRGEVVLVALTMLGNGGPQALPPVALARVITSLRAVGLVAEARALAREAVAALLP